MKCKSGERERPLLWLSSCYVVIRRTSVGSLIMGLAEVNLAGVYVAPLAVIMALAWMILLILRRIGARCGLFRYVWHPPLFSFAVYVILVSSIVLCIAH